MQAAAEEFVDQNGFKDLGTQDKELAKKTLLGETT
jgi:hypothetical protein